MVFPGGAAWHPYRGSSLRGLSVWHAQTSVASKTGGREVGVLCWAHSVGSNNKCIYLNVVNSCFSFHLHVWRCNISSHEIAPTQKKGYYISSAVTLVWLRFYTSEQQSSIHARSQGRICLMITLINLFSLSIIFVCNQSVKKKKFLMFLCFAVII